MSLELIRKPLEMKSWAREQKGSMGFVPTMGALHEGHLSLIERSQKENHKTLVSIFVNPVQFNDPKDLEHYPRTLEQDLELLKKLHVDCVFAPDSKDIYPDDYRFKLTENKDSTILCGKDRPGHFDGVLTVVLKLFNIIAPTHAYFGEKDFQQLHLIQEMSKALFLDTKVIACPTYRAESGLALSSRNQRLSKVAIKRAPEFVKILKEAASREMAQAELEKAGFDVLYVDEQWKRRLAAIRLEDVRLIDNVAL